LHTVADGEGDPSDEEQAFNELELDSEDESDEDYVGGDVMEYDMDPDDSELGDANDDVFGRLMNSG